ncbi:hypothetical protein ACJX0J_007255, partial [Zea mays]
SFSILLIYELGGLRILFSQSLGQLREGVHILLILRILHNNEDHEGNFTLSGMDLLERTCQAQSPHNLLHLPLLVETFHHISVKKMKGLFLAFTQGLSRHKEFTETENMVMEDYNYPASQFGINHPYCTLFWVPFFMEAIWSQRNLYVIYIIFFISFFKILSRKTLHNILRERPKLLVEQDDDLEYKRLVSKEEWHCALAF